MGAARRWASLWLLGAVVWGSLGGFGARAAGQLTASHKDAPFGLAGHLSALRAERLDAFLSALGSAEPELQRAVQGELSSRAKAAGSTADPIALGRARRMLAGEPSAGELGDLAESLDLMVVPGWYFARAAPSPESSDPPLSIQVRVWMALGQRRPQAEVELCLWLLDEWGGQREVRRVSASPEAFAPPGFDLFFRAPAGPPATYRLVLELRQGERWAKGAPVLLEAVGGGQDPLGPLWPAPVGESAERTWVRERLSELSEFGWRAADGVPPSARLRWLEGGSERPLLPLPPEDTSPAGGADSAEVLALSGSGPVQWTAVVLAPAGEAAGALFHGHRGLPWQRLVREHGARVVSVAAADVPTATRAISALAAGAARERQDFYLVLRGSALLGSLTLAALGQDPDFLAADPSALMRLAALPALGPAAGRSLVLAPGAPAALAPEGRSTWPADPWDLRDDLAWPERLVDWRRVRGERP